MCGGITSACWGNCRRPGLAAMMLALSLCCAACVSGPRLMPSVAHTAQGNAILAALPAGTVLQLPNAKDTDLMRALFVNEVEAAGAGLRLFRPLRLATPAYIVDRDQREVELLMRIEVLRGGGQEGVKW